MDPLSYNEKRSRPTLEEQLESIISAAALMADADCTRDERRERIVAECNAVRQALQDLLSAYMSNVSATHLLYRIRRPQITNISFPFADGPEGEELHSGPGNQSNVPEDA